MEPVDDTLKALIGNAIGQTIKMLACYTKDKFYNELTVTQKNIRFSGDSLKMKNIIITEDADIDISAKYFVRLLTGFKTAKGSVVR